MKSQRPARDEHTLAFVGRFNSIIVDQFFDNADLNRDLRLSRRTAMIIVDDPRSE